MLDHKFEKLNKKLEEKDEEMMRTLNNPKYATEEEFEEMNKTIKYLERVRFF